MKGKMNIDITKKLNMLADLVRDCQHVQETPEGLTRKQTDIGYMTNLLDEYNRGEELSKVNMLICNDMYKRYRTDVL